MKWRAKFVTGLIFSAIGSFAFIPANAQTWAPSETQKQAIEQQSLDYFSALDRRDYRQMRAMFVPGVLARMPEEQFAQFQTSNLQRYGRVTSRRILRVSWYPRKQPNGRIRVQAAADFLGTTERGAFCGYIVLVERKDGVFEIFRDDTLYLEADWRASVRDPKMQQTLNRPGCRDLVKAQ